MVERFGRYAFVYLRQSVSVGVVSELIIWETGAAIEFFGKASSPFCIPVARYC